MSAGTIAGEELREHARRLVTEARGSPKRVLAEGAELLDALDRTEHATRSIILRAMGLAARWAATLGDSIDYLEGAADAAGRADNPVLAAEARLSLSGSQAIAGDMTAALETLQVARSVDDPAMAARADFQLGSIHARMANRKEALAAWDQALPAFEASGDRMRQAMTLHNRGHLLVYSGDLDMAERELTLARDIFDDLGIRAEAAGAQQNLGLVALYRGDIATALRRFDESEARVQELTGAAYEVQVSHCEALMSAGLYTDAAHMAAAARRQMREAGLGADAAEATLALATAQLRAGKMRSARESALEAAAMFDEQNRTGWGAHARYLALLAGVDHDSPTKRTQREARALAADLDQAGQYIPAAGARLIAGRIGLQRGDIRGARADLLAVAENRRVGPVEVGIQGWLALALLRRAEGNGRGADAAARAGMRTLTTFQAALGATDVRVGVADHANELGRIGLELALAASGNDRLLRWMERTRASAMRLRPVTPPQDTELAEATQQLRLLTDALRRAGPDELGAMRTRQSELQRVVAVRARSVSGRDRGPDRDVADLASVRRCLGDRVLVEIADLDGELWALVVDARRSRRHHIDSAAPMKAELDSLRLLMRRSARSADGDMAPQLAAQVASQLDSALFGSLRLGPGPLVIVPPANLYAVPWSLLPSCRGRELSVVPSATVWLESRRERPSRGPIVLAAGPRLAHASQEVRNLQHIYENSVRFNSRQATVERVIDTIDGAALAHFACHGSFNAENPMFSALHLADGDLTVYDLERLDVAPEVVVLSACESGLSAARPGDELLGLASAFHSLGTKALVASVGLVPDTVATRRFMQRFHKSLNAGRSPAAALATAAASTRSRTEAAAAASFVCFGAG